MATGSSADTPDVASQRWAPRWWAVFLIGLLLWVASIGAAYLTGDLILLPTIVLLGSFLVPVTAVVWYLDHDPSPALSPMRIFSAFVIAAPVGVLAAALLEYYLVGTGLLGNLEVGLIEELVKAVLIFFVAWGIRQFHTRDGMVLGAAVGFGFAALESSGYALVSLFVVHGRQIALSLTSVVTTELIRGILAPFGHGMWSAIVGGVIFSAAARRGRLRLAWSVVGAYLLVAVLHAAFDAISGIIGYVAVSIVGLAPLVWLWLRADGGGVLPRPRRPAGQGSALRP
jgi:RsiW-degrading membrane proteinase PrsW (M82 family)